MSSGNYLDENENFRQGLRTVQEAWTGMFSRLSEENGNLSKAVEELRRENGGLQRRLQTSEREVLETRQQLASCARQLEELGNHNKILSAQVSKWKSMTQTFQRMFTESGVDDDLLPPAPPASTFAASFAKQPPVGEASSFLSASPARDFAENSRSYLNGAACASGLPLPSPTRMTAAAAAAGESGVPDTKTFLAAVRERLGASDAKAVVELVKTLRFSTKDEVLSKARLFLTADGHGHGHDHDDLLAQLAAICDRSCC